MEDLDDGVRGYRPPPWINKGFAKQHYASSQGMTWGKVELSAELPDSGRQV